MRPFIEDFPFGSNRAADAPPPSDAAVPVVLAAGASQAIAVPPGARFVGFSFTTDVWVAFGMSAAVTVTAPTATGAPGSGGSLNPSARRLPSGVTHIALSAETAGKGSLDFWG